MSNKRAHKSATSRKTAVMKFFRFRIVTTMDRNAAISEVGEAISKCRGWIENQVFFSNKAATIRFEIPADRLGKFQTDLLERGLRSYIDDELPHGGAGDVKATVSLTFAHQEPDLKREVPPFG